MKVLSVFDFGELERGDRFFENCTGMLVEAEVLKAPEKTLLEDGESYKYEWKARNVKTGEILSYMGREDHPAYAPRIYVEGKEHE